MTEYQKLLMNRHNLPGLNKLDKMLLDALCEIPGEDGFEDEMLIWLKEHPNADLQEIATYMNNFLEPLEIVDDDEMDEDWEE